MLRTPLRGATAGRVTGGLLIEVGGPPEAAAPGIGSLLRQRGSVHVVEPFERHGHPCLYPLQQGQLRHSGNQNSAACGDNTPFWDGTAPGGR